ncbi:MAG TPA: efflux RND transporter periplasmic adaptor subunit [Candidatus Limnocylindrales bacterium]|nr:efflux RND transporter periplasmic adaptor subunit [Candidatus Limnocylindrales bacterium]
MKLFTEVASLHLMKMKVRPKLLFMGVGGVLLLVVVVVSTGALRKPKLIAPEKIVTSEKGDIARSVVARGKIEPLSKVEVKSKANGIIKALMVDVGNMVTEGQILAELDKEDLEAQVREAKATRDGEEANLLAAIAAEAKTRIEAANPDLEFARRDYERAQGLFKEKIASEQQLDDASRAYEVAKNRQQLLDATVQTAGAQVVQARARVAAAKAALDRAEETLRYATIRAPIAGIVLSRPTEVGDAVSSILNLGSAATLIMTLGDMSSVYIKGEVDEADIGKAACGQHVRTKVESFPGDSFEGLVKRIDPMGKEQNNVTTFEVRVTISNPDGKLRVNMTANAEIVLEEHKQVLLVPEAALVYDKDKKASVQLLDSTSKTGWRKIAIKTGISNGQRTEVLEGVKEGAKLVLP